LKGEGGKIKERRQWIGRNDRELVKSAWRMHWDVVEVKPESGYSLFVRFKDGLAGRVQLRRADLTGALAPLMDDKFFEQVFIDYGAVAWPGEIDLAPDAMYTQVASADYEVSSRGRVH
jgi:hypothetical protein